MLESRGLIRARGNGSFAVAEFQSTLHQSLGLLVLADEADEVELFEVRLILEGETAALAATRRMSEHLTEMAAAIDEMEGRLVDEKAFIDADLAFHLTVARACGNRVALHLMHAIRGQIQHAFGSAFVVPGGPERSIVQHREILAAIAARQSDEARRLMHSHIQRVEREIHRRA